MQENKAKFFNNRNSNNEQALAQQLEHEIQCLERQLSRLQIVGSGLNKKTHTTYEEMISSRKAMLSELNT